MSNKYYITKLKLWHYSITKKVLCTPIENTQQRSMFVSITTVFQSIIVQKVFSLARKMGWLKKVLSLWRAGLLGVAQIGKCPVSGPQHRKGWMTPLSQFCGDQTNCHTMLVNLHYNRDLCFSMTYPSNDQASNEIMHLTLFSVRCIYICATRQALRLQTCVGLYVPF